MQFADPVQEQSVVEEFNAARDDEYAEVLERIPALREELAEERARGRATYAEVEESEADLERFRSWLAKIAARDYFAAPGGEATRRAVEEAAADMEDFEREALQAEAEEDMPASTSPRLRKVDQS
jgi:hypothetical protein